MTSTRIEQAFKWLLDNSHAYQTQLATTFFDALIEQNIAYLSGEVTSSALAQNNQKLRNLQLTAEEWRRVFQFLFLKGGKTDRLQANHQFTPDSMGFILLFLLETLTDKERLAVLEIGSGTGNLAHTLLNNSQKELDYLGIELDDLLIELSASISEVMGSDLTLVQADAVRPQVLKESDVILSDLPIGYYPDDAIASRYQVAAESGHTYAHHLLMEQALKYLKPQGLAIFLAPSDLLTSPQAPLLKKWLSSQASVLGVVTLPDKLFGSEQLAKSIFILQKQGDSNRDTFVYRLGDLKDRDSLVNFMTAVRNWKTRNGV